jgi:hypothetical protein
MIKVLGIDVASANWASNGSAVLAFEPGDTPFTHLDAPAIAWPNKSLTADALATTIDEFVREMAVKAVALDGPQGWRDPKTPAGTPGVGRRCEYECRTQAKTGVRPQTYPSNQRAWVEFCIDLFTSLLSKPDVHLARVDGCGAVPREGYVVLECFPTSIWRAAGLTPLPAKSRVPDLTPYAEQLFAAFGIPRARVASHDDLQATVAALAAAGYVGGPGVATGRGTPAVTVAPDDGEVRVEGLIWEVRPADMEPSSIVHAEASHAAQVPVSLATSACVRVTQGVIDQVVRVGRSQAQIALQGFPGGTSRERIDVIVTSGDDLYPLVVGDSHAAWVKHQTGDASEGFDRLFARLSDRAGEWLPVTWRRASPPPHASQGDHLASQGPQFPDPMARTVSIPVRIEGGTIKEFDDKPLPELEDCIGELVVPAFAIKNQQDLERLTAPGETMLFEAGTPLLCRVSGRQVPNDMSPLCRVEPVPDSPVPGAFVEFLLEEPLYLCTHGTKRPTLKPARCIVPALKNLQAGSLNEAYRRISERFEPERRSVGGNVFRSVYYFEPAMDQWRPIGELRGDLIFVPR